MKRYKFTVAQHEEYGGLGFKPSWYSAGEPLPGMTVAHDILEHFPKDDGSAEGEYMALGASLFIRGNAGYYGRNGGNSSPEENIGSDLPTVWGIQSHVKPCGLSRDQDIMDQARAACTHAAREFAYRDESERPSAEDYERIARWIAKGYQRARKRYAGFNAGAIAWSLFQPIEELADKALKHADEGMVLTVLVDFKNLNVRVDCDYPQEEGY